MRYVRYQPGYLEPKYGWILGDLLGELEGSPFGAYRRREVETPISKVRLLSPVLPGKIIGIIQNFLKPSPEIGDEIPELPSIYFKPPSCVIGAGQSIVIPPQVRQIEHEVQLAVVIGRSGRWITSEKAKDFIFGYTVATNIVARDLQKLDHQEAQAMSFDTFLSLGPWLETELDVTDALLTCRVKNELRQMASTREMIFTIPQLIAFISSVMTLDPGDVILTGTPVGSGSLKPGDIVQSSVEGIGDLFNPVVSEVS
jgi:2-keto-4-pentenoate hydratase/2-oxohepta-3-ene-1,7-dioic acid hydratase in catechol pathway